MSDSNPSQPAEIPTFVELAADPEIAPLLGFEPVVRKVKRPDGWTPELQRELIARIAATGTLQSAVWQMGKHATGAEALYKTPGADSFRQSWDAAIIIGRRRNGLDRGPPFTGAVPGITRRSGRGHEPEPQPEPDPGMNEDELWEACVRVAAKFLKKVAAERRARLAGEITAADFFLRQITALEVTFDLAAHSCGMSAWEAINQVRLAGETVYTIAETEFSQWLDRARRKMWADEAAPERPQYPPRHYLAEAMSSEGDRVMTEPLHNGTGACTTPARGYTKEEWAALPKDEQRAALQRQFEEDSAEQVQWELRAIAEHKEQSHRDT